MKNRFRPNSSYAVLAAVAAVLGASFLLATQTPADALNREKQVMSGGFNNGPNVTTLYTSPGHATTIQADYPSTGDGENAAQVRMPAGTLGNLRVRVRTATVPTSGALTVTVRINGQDTALTCSVSGTGNCQTAGATKVDIENNDRLAIEITSTLENEGNFTLTYTLVYD